MRINKRTAERSVLGLLGKNSRLPGFGGLFGNASWNGA